MPKLTEKTDRWVTFTEEEVIELLAEKAGVSVTEVNFISYPDRNFFMYGSPKIIRLTLK